MRYRRFTLTAIFLLFPLHQDFWNWENGTLYWNLPVGLFFHLLLCLIASALFMLLVLGEKGSGEDL